MIISPGMVGKRPLSCSSIYLRRGCQSPSVSFLSRRWARISTRVAGETPQLDQLPIDTSTELDAGNPDAKFEVLGAPYSLITATLSASQPLYTRRGTLVGLSGKADNVVSTLSVLEPFRRIVLGIPFFYQKITSASPVSVLISTKSPFTSLATIHLNGTLDWMISQRNALLGWTGQTLSLNPRVNTSMSLAHWGQTQATGRGLLALVGKGQIYEITLKQDEQYVVHPSNIVAYSMTKNPPLPYRFKSSVLRFEVPGKGIITRLIPDVKFFRTMQETATWRFISRAFYALRTWSRTTIWGDRLFLQFQGPATILLQTRASRVSDVLTSRDVNEIADSEPGVIEAAAAPSLRESKSTEPKPVATAPSPTKMTYASVGGDGQVSFRT